MKKEKLWQLLLLLALIVIVCSFFTRSLTSSGTLYDYAKQNPEIAYAPNEVESINSSEAELEISESETATSEANESETEESEVLESNTELESETYDKDRIAYAEGFFYEPISSEIEARIRGISYPEDDSNIAISLDDLSYVGVLYNDFEGNVKEGELICNSSIALDMVEIFEELYRSGYQFEQITLIDEYGGDDTLSMENNNTSCFNYRIVDGSDHLSKHAYGLAIDINPFYNPYVVFNKDGSGETYISPKGSEVYADRSKDFPYKIDENDLCYKLFIEHGFTWGGNWNSSKDYQHFQKVQ